MSDILEIQSHCSEMEDNEVVIPEKLEFSAKKRKGRGFDSHYNTQLGKIKHFDSLDYDATKKQDYPQKSVEGWVVFASGLHEEANEEDVKSLFSEYGQVTNIAVNIDRRTGFLKGYALVEYKTYEEASKAKENLDESSFLDTEITVNWAFLQKPIKRERSHFYKHSSLQTKLNRI